MAAVADVVNRELQARHRRPARDRLRSALRAQSPARLLLDFGGSARPVPYASRGGFDLIASGMSGLMSINGPADGPPFRIPHPHDRSRRGTQWRHRHPCRAGRPASGPEPASTSTPRSSSPGSRSGVYEAAGVFATGEVPERLGQGQPRQRALPALPHRRQLHDHRLRERPLLGADLRGCSAAHTSPPTPRFATKPDRASRTSRRWWKRADAVLRARDPPRTGARGSRRSGCRRGR